ncbi:hypothetical protein Tco_1457570 [Tanacetum coccineum]
MNRQRQKEEIKTKYSKKAVDAEQSLLNRVNYACQGLTLLVLRPQTDGTLKSLKDSKQDKDTPEGPTLKTEGPEGEITLDSDLLNLLDPRGMDFSSPSSQSPAAKMFTLTGLEPEEFAARNDLVQALPDRNQAIPDGGGATPRPSRGGWAASASRTNNIKFDSGD